MNPGKKREQVRAATRRHYYANKEQYRARNTEARRRKAAWLIEQKNKPCLDCGHRYPHYVMEFGHVMPVLRRRVSQLTSCSWVALREEIARCELVCANCHAARTWKRKQTSSTAAGSRTQTS